MSFLSLFPPTRKKGSILIRKPSLSRKPTLPPLSRKPPLSRFARKILPLSSSRENPPSLELKVISIKIIRNKITGQPEGYRFIEFISHAAAERILQTYNGVQMPGTEHTFWLNWASFGIGERRADAGPDHSIFVGDLAPDVTDYLLQETFRVNYLSVRGAKVVTDPSTGRSKGYGFVKFADEMERNRAMTEMNGVFCSSRAMRISAATPKKPTGVQQQTWILQYVNGLENTTPQLPPVPPDNDNTNTTLYVGGLDPNVSEEELRQIFVQFGELVYVKIPAGKGCGFVQFCTRVSAEEAIKRMHGTMIGQQIVRLSWGRTPASQQGKDEVDNLQDQEKMLMEQNLAKRMEVQKLENEHDILRAVEDMAFDDHYTMECFLIKILMYGCY